MAVPEGPLRNFQKVLRTPTDPESLNVSWLKPNVRILFDSKFDTGGGLHRRVRYGVFGFCRDKGEIEINVWR
jgi:hypothetical protein